MLTSLAVGSSACATVWTPVEGSDGARLRHRKLGFSLAQLSALVGRDEGAAWREEHVDGAELAYRRSDGSQLSLLTECGRGVTLPEIRARQLLYGVGERGEITGFEVDLQGLSGWVQRLVASEGPAAVHLKTVTVIDGVCTIDWLLVQPVGASSAEPLFDAWWRSFRRSRPEPGRIGAAAGETRAGGLADSRGALP